MKNILRFYFYLSCVGIFIYMNKPEQELVTLIVFGVWFILNEIMIYKK